MPEIPEPNYDNPSEVFAFVGLALYSANLLETSIVNLATVLDSEKVAVIKRETFIRLFETFETKTFGQLLKATRKLMPIPDEVDSKLEIALKKRNHLAHGFFREHSSDLMHPVGKQKIINELRDMIAVFQSADKLITPIYLLLWKKYGITKDSIDDEIKKIRLEIEEKYV